MRKIIKGISTLNPVDIEKEYLDFTVDYAISHGFDHYQLIGPIHDAVRGNIDGMTFSDKYARFNGEKDAEYVKYCLEVVNPALEKLSAAGIKSYMWHHELDLPAEFGEAFPDALNDYGDVEVTHPLVKVVYDIYHQQVMEGNIIPSVTSNLECIAHLHSAGHPGRHELQMGENDYKFIFSKIDEAGYNGACGLEYNPILEPIESLKLSREIYGKQNIKEN